MKCREPDGLSVPVRLPEHTKIGMKQVIGETGRPVAPLEEDEVRSAGIEHPVDRPAKARTPPREREAALLVGHGLHYRDLPQWVALRLHLDLPVCGDDHVL